MTTNVGANGARVLAGIVDHWSVPCLALLVSAVAQRFLGRELLRRAGRQAAWSFSAVAGIALYPLALGWGPVDPLYFLASLVIGVLAVGQPLARLACGQDRRVAHVLPRAGHA